MKAFGWKRAIRMAESIIADAKKLSSVIEEAVKKMQTHSEALGGIIDDLQVIFRLVRTWVKGDYKEVAKQSLIILVAAVVYFLMPVDAIPDVIPVIGLMDDVTVIGLALAAVKAEIDRFREWENMRGDEG